MKNVITYEELFIITSKRKSDGYSCGLKRYRKCFSGNIKRDVANANLVIDSIVNNNSAHSRAAMFRWCYNHFYGIKFNPKYIHSRPGEVSKMTTRLDINQIRLARGKFKEWIFEEHPRMVENLKESIKLYRTRVYHIFESLICSGMRIGELCAIKFHTSSINRVIKSKLNGQEQVEIIINTEKTCKQREIYLPKECFEFFCNDPNSMYGFNRDYLGEIARIWIYLREKNYIKSLTNPYIQDPKRLKRVLVTQGFIAFRNWAKLPFRFHCHAFRRTKASIMHECGVDVHTISMVLGNTVRTVMDFYIISSARNYDACDIANAMVNGSITKTENLYMNTRYLYLNRESNADTTFSPSQIAYNQFSHST